jgi:S1-C subfamily serine protease
MAPAAALVTLTIERPTGAGRPRTLSEPVTLSKKHVAALRPIISEVEEPSWRGLRLEFSTAIPQFDERATAIDAEGCVAIVEVAEGSPAAKAELRPRMFISHVENQRVSTPKEFFETVAAMQGPVHVRLTEKIGESYTRVIEP